MDREVVGALSQSLKIHPDREFAGRELVPDRTGARTLTDACRLWALTRTRPSPRFLKSIANGLTTVWSSIGSEDETAATHTVSARIRASKSELRFSRSQRIVVTSLVQAARVPIRASRLTTPSNQSGSILGGRGR